MLQIGGASYRTSKLCMQNACEPLGLVGFWHLATAVPRTKPDKKAHGRNGGRETDIHALTVRVCAREDKT